MPPPRSFERLALVVVCVLALLGLAWLALQAIGWFGVGLLGLFIAFVAIRFELEENRPVGHQMTPDLYASQFHKHGREHEAERAGFRTELIAQISAARLGLGLGLLLTAIGFGFFFILEIGR